MARIDIVMPQMGESIAEGTLSRWLKAVGDQVKRDEPIFEISTDKVDAEIPAPSAGVLAEILVQEGETVEVQTVVARLETDTAAAATSPATSPATSAPSPSAVAPSQPPVPAEPPPVPQPPETAATTVRDPEPPASTIDAGQPSAPPVPAQRQDPDAGAGRSKGDETLEERLTQKSTPLVRRMVAEHDLRLGDIPGTGLAGRVTKNDVLDFLERGVPRTATEAPASAETHTPATRVSGPLVQPWPGDRVEPWSRIRKLTADHMVMSRRVSAHVHSVIEVDYSRVASLRAAKKSEYGERGVNLTFLAFIAKAVADALPRHPVLNAAVSGESTIYRREVNLGVAVALDWGLIVPVIRHADGLSLLGMARAINDLAERARGKRLSPDEVQKGTFTITNPGVFGTFVGLPILNQPQSAILAVGAVEKRPSVVQGTDGVDALAIRTKGMLALSFDHRIVDGADADRFLAELRVMLQEFPESAT